MFTEVNLHLSTSWQAKSGFNMTEKRGTSLVVLLLFYCNATKHYCLFHDGVHLFSLFHCSRLITDSIIFVFFLILFIWDCRLMLSAWWGFKFNVKGRKKQLVFKCFISFDTQYKMLLFLQRSLILEWSTRCDASENIYNEKTVCFSTSISTLTRECVTSCSNESYFILWILTIKGLKALTSTSNTALARGDWRQWSLT